jgi:hypothetical protein
MKIYFEYNTEIRRLSTLYNGTTKSYLYYSTYLKENRYKESNPKDIVYLNPENLDNHLIAGNEFEYVNRLEKGYSKSLREIILIRLISNLEVFLIKVIREIFLHRKDLFHKEGNIEFSHSELLSTESISQLWTKLINKECRNLQNQGFREVKKYYLKTFNIELAQSGVSLKYIEKLHDIRHLLVHRLGRIDNEFIHKYNTKGKSVTITEIEFYEAIIELKKIAEFIKIKYEEIIENKNVVKKQIINSVLNLTIKLNNNNSEFIINDEYSFLSKEKYLMFRDILKNRTKIEEDVELELIGHIEDLLAYEKSIANYIKIGNIEIIKRTKKISPFDWFSKQEIKLIKDEMQNGDIEEEKLVELSTKLKIAKGKIAKLIIEIKRINK